MTISAKDILNEVARDLRDSNNRAHTRAELLDFLNAGQRKIAVDKPDSSSVASVIQLAAGINQSGPTGCVAVLDVRVNMGTDGQVRGSSITKVERRDLDACVPDWPSMDPDEEVQHFFFDEREPRRFGVYPPQPGSGCGYVEVLASVTPTTITDEEQPIGLPDQYREPLANYIKGRCYLTAAKSGNLNAAVAFGNAFVTDLSLEAQAQSNGTPNRMNQGQTREPNA